MKLRQMTRQILILGQLLCSLSARIQAQNIDGEVKERLEVMDCTNTICYNIKTNGPYIFPWITYASKLCSYYGMTPAKPTDEETGKFLMNFANRTITDDYPVWLGLSQEETVNNSAFINLWGTYPPQTVEDGKVAMKRKSGFKWEITNPSTAGWPLCEIPKANLSYCVNNACYTLYPTTIQSDKAAQKLCELSGKKIAVPKTPELAKQLAEFYSFGNLPTRIGIYLDNTLLVDINQNVIGNRDEWPFGAGEFNAEQKCVFIRSGELYQGDCSKRIQYPLCEDLVLDEAKDHDDEEKEPNANDAETIEEENDDESSEKEDDDELSEEENDDESSEEEDDDEESSEEEEEDDDDEESSEEEEDDDDDEESSEEEDDDDDESYEEDEEEESYEDDNDE